jgi:hypothetical protein
MLLYSYETMDRKYTIGLVNLYTQQSPFFSTLNKEMRNNYPTNWTKPNIFLEKCLKLRICTD